MKRHTGDILHLLEEGRKNKQLFLEQTGMDVKAMVENGFDANSGRVHPTNCPLVKAIDGLGYEIFPPQTQGEWNDE